LRFGCTDWTHGRGSFWFSTGVDYASPQENIVAALALVYHATSTGSEQLLKEHMTELMMGSGDYAPDGSWRPPSKMLPEWPPSLGVRPAKMLASLVADPQSQ
jgi:hypothetical protein